MPTTQELYDQVKAGTAGAPGVIITIRGTSVHAEWPNGSLYFYPTEDTKRIANNIANVNEISAEVAKKTASLPPDKVGLDPTAAAPTATPAPTTPAAVPATGTGYSPSAAAAGAAAGSFPGGFGMPAIVAKGVVPQIEGETNVAYAARRRLLAKATGDHSPASIKAAVEYQKRTAQEMDRADAASRSREAGVRNVKSAANAVAASIVKVADVAFAAMKTAKAQAVAAKGFRGRTGTPFANDRGFDPPTYIEIAQMPANQQATVDLSKIKSLGVKYNDFFITDSQETDAEKAEVSETFGAPHVFATGRYMRKVMISGVCRTGAVNPDILTTSTQLASMSDQDKGKYVVPHTLGLRVLYDRALRASEQIARSLFSRLVIDGEVYCGWFTTLNISRTGAEEGFAHFTMSMLVFARYHKDEDWAAKLLNTGSLPAKTAFTDAAATATLTSMAGTMVIKLSASTAEVQQTVDETTTDELQFKSPLSLIISGNAQPVKVSVSVAISGPSFPVQGFILKFGNTSSSRVSLDGSTTGVGTFDLVPAITDFAAFLQSANPLGKTGKLNVPLTITLKPALGEVITTLTVNLVVNTVQTPKSAGMTVRLGTDSTDLPSNVNKEAKDIFQTPTTSVITLRFNVQNAAGNPLKLTQDMLTATVATLWDPEKNVTLATTGPKVEAKTGTLNAVEKADTDIASKAGAAKVTVGPVLTLLEESTSLVELAVTFDYAQLGTNLKTVNPFVSAKDLVTSFRYKLKIGSFNEFLTEKVTVAARYEKSWIQNLIMSIAGVDVSSNNHQATEAGSFALGTLAKNVAGSLNDTVSRITFNLSPSAAPLVASKREEAVKQAINMIVSQSTYAIEGGGGITAIFGVGQVAGFTSVDKIPLAVVTTLNETQAVIEVPECVGWGSRPMGSGAARTSSKTLVMTVPSSIAPIPQFTTATT